MILMLLLMACWKILPSSIDNDKNDDPGEAGAMK
jgi:hypothetical protein